VIERNGGDDRARTRDLRRDRSALCTRHLSLGFCGNSSTLIEFGIFSKLGLGVRRRMSLF
jgi:hypothetical protein